MAVKSFRNVTDGSLCRKVDVLRQFSGHDVLMRLVKGRDIELLLYDSIASFILAVCEIYCVNAPLCFDFVRLLLWLGIDPQ